MFNRILVGINSSDNNQHAFEEAIALAKLTNASLMLLHVLSPVNIGYPTPPFPYADGFYSTMQTEAVESYMQQMKVLEKQGLELLKALTNRAIADGVVAEFTQNLGDPGQAICNLAQTWSADLIVVGRRGRSGLGELVMGSVSNYVMHHAPCSVLTIQGSIHRETTVSQPETVAAASVS